MATRDRVPFVLTSDMAYVINGGDKPSSQFQSFVDQCCHAYNILRKHRILLVNLFSLVGSVVHHLCIVGAKPLVREQVKLLSLLSTDSTTELCW